MSCKQINHKKSKAKLAVLRYAFKKQPIDIKLLTTININT
nr:MAG TPA: hypothetical protein [Caudoviricetes sp.]